jgi:hypothetical protein
MKCRYKDAHEQVASTHPFLVALFDNPTLEWKDVIMLGLETFAAGIDAVSEVRFTRILYPNTSLKRRTRKTEHILSYIQELV